MQRGKLQSDAHLALKLSDKKVLLLCTNAIGAWVQKSSFVSRKSGAKQPQGCVTSATQSSAGVSCSGS